MSEQITFASIIDIKKGGYITKKDAKVGPYPVVLGGREPAYYIDKYNHTGNAIVISRSGASAGYVSRWSEPIFVTDGFLIEPKKSVDYDFVYYALKNSEGILQGRQSGSAIPHVTPRIINSIKVNIPPLDSQRKIADILLKYDDLIENNQKQIRLLEEAAQRLYKEWFVDLRFPEHENVKIVDGVPEGWKQTTLSEIAVINKQSIGKEYSHAIIEYVDLGSVSNGHIQEKKIYSLQDAPGRARRIAEDGDIIWGMVRPNLRAFALVQKQAADFVYSTGFAVISAELVPFTYLYCLTTTDEFVGYLVGCTNGSAYPAVKPSHFENAEITVPSKHLLRLFHLKAEPIFRKIGVLDEMNSSLKEARDRLLPKLMSGEIEV